MESDSTNMQANYKKRFILMALISIVALSVIPVAGYFYPPASGHCYGPDGSMWDCPPANYVRLDPFWVQTFNIISLYIIGTSWFIAILGWGLHRFFVSRSAKVAKVIDIITLMILIVLWIAIIDNFIDLPRLAAMP